MLGLDASMWVLGITCTCCIVLLSSIILHLYLYLYLIPSCEGVTPSFHFHITASTVSTNFAGQPNRHGDMHLTLEEIMMVYGRVVW